MMTLTRVRQLYAEAVAAHKEAKRLHLDRDAAAQWKRIHSLRKIWTKINLRDGRK